MDALDLIWDPSFQTPAVTDPNWDEALRAYKEQLYDCKPPNALFVNCKYLQLDPNNCSLKNWIQPVNHETWPDIWDKLLHLYLVAAPSAGSKVMISALTHTAQREPGQAENILSWIDQNYANIPAAAMASGKALHHNYNETTIDLLGKLLTRNYAAKFWPTQSSSELLIYYSFHHATNDNFSTVFADLLAREDFPEQTRTELFKQCYAYTALKEKLNAKAFYPLETLLDFDTEEHHLAIALLYGYELHGYQPSPNVLKAWEKLLGNGKESSLAAKLVIRVLEKEIPKASTPDKESLLRLPLLKIFTHADGLGALPQKIAEAYRAHPDIWGYMAAEMLAVVGNLPSATLEKMLIDNPHTKEDIWIAQRLTKFGVTSEANQALLVSHLPQPHSYLSDNLLYWTFQDPIWNELSQHVLDRSVQRLQNLHWPLEALSKVAAKLQPFQKPALLHSLELLAEYKILPDMFDRHLITAMEVFTSFDPAKWVEAIYRLIHDNYFFLPKTTEELLKEFVKDNNGKPNADKIANQAAATLQDITAMRANWFESNHYVADRITFYPEVQINYTPNVDFWKWDLKCSAQEMQGQNVHVQDIQQIYVYQNQPTSCRPIANFWMWDAKCPANDLLEQNDVRDRVDQEALNNGYVTKQLQLWQEQEFKVWRASISQVTDERLTEIIAVLAEAMHSTLGYYPRDAQILALIAWQHQPQGGLLQILSGEGKSATNFLKAAIWTLDGHKPDIITTHEDLAKRDPLNSKAFFALLGMSVAHTLENNGHDEAKPAYVADVLFTIMLPAVGDSLRDITKNIRNGRAYDKVLIDEVDSFTLDQLKMRVQLSGIIPGFEMARGHLFYLYHNGLMQKSLVEQKPDGCYTTLPEALQKIMPEDATFSATRVGDDCFEFRDQLLFNSTYSMMFGDDTGETEVYVPVPRHLNEFLKNHLNRWVDSFWSAMGYQKYYDYATTEILYAGTNSTTYEIAPVDRINTGEIQTSLRWEDGLHSLLQARNFLPMVPENLVNTFQSYVAYFKRYQGGIYGLSGTLGTADDENFIQYNFGVGVLHIPTFAHKNFVQFDAVKLGTREAWIDEIIQSVHRNVGSERAGLVLVNPILEVEEFESKLIASGYPKELILRYSGIKDNYHPDSRKLQPGQVVIATNKAGRGSDIQLSKAVLQHGGLHVILTHFPANSRLDNQGFWRAARKDEPGSGQFILWDPSNTDFATLSENRDANERVRLRAEQYQGLPNLLQQDSFHDRFVDLIKEVCSPTGYVIEQGGWPKQPVAKYAYASWQNGTLHLDIATIQKEHLHISIDWKLLALARPTMARHIQEVLRDGKGNLNGEAQQLIHYFMAEKDVTHYPIVMNRVNEAWKIKGLDPEKLLDQPLYEYIKKIMPRVNEAWEHKALDPEELLDQPLYEYIKNSSSPHQDKLDAVKLHAMSKLWLEDGESYNNDEEVSQLKEEFAKFFKENRYLFQGDECDLTADAGIKACEIDRKERNDLLTESFAAFKRDAVAQFAVDTLIQNPHYYTIKAWRYTVIQQNQQQYGGGGGLFAIFDSVPVAENTGWLSSTPQFFQSGWSYVTNTLENWSAYVIDSLPGSIKNGNIANWNGPGEVLNPLADALGFLNKALPLAAGNYDWAIWSARADITLMKDGSDIQYSDDKKQMKKAQEVLQKYAHDISMAIGGLHKIAHYKDAERLTMLNVGNASEIVMTAQYVDYLCTASLYRDLVKPYQDNFDKISALDEQMVGVGREVDIDKIAHNVNATQLLLEEIERINEMVAQEAQRSGGAVPARNITLVLGQGMNIEWHTRDRAVAEIYAIGAHPHELYVYDLKQSDDWSGTIMSVVFAVAQIGIGIATAGSASVFMSTLGKGLIMAGVGDGLRSTISVLSGHPIPMDQLINNKGMELAVTLATAGLLHGLNALDIKLFQGLTQAAGSFDKAAFITKAVMMQVGMVALDQVIQQVSHDMVDEQAIAQKVDDAMSALKAQELATLERIFATDEANYNINLQLELYAGTQQVMTKYQQWYLKSTGLEFTLKVIGNVAGQAAGAAFGAAGGFAGYVAGQLGQKFAEAGRDAIRDDHAIPEMQSGIRKVIEEVGKKATTAPNKDHAYYEPKLASYFSSAKGVMKGVVTAGKEALLQQLLSIPASWLSNYMTDYIYKGLFEPKPAPQATTQDEKKTEPNKPEESEQKPEEPAKKKTKPAAEKAEQSEADTKRAKKTYPIPKRRPEPGNEVPLPESGLKGWKQAAYEKDCAAASKKLDEQNMSDSERSKTKAELYAVILEIRKADANKQKEILQALAPEKPGFIKVILQGILQFIPFYPSDAHASPILAIPVAIEACAINPACINMIGAFVVGGAAYTTGVLGDTYAAIYNALKTNYKTTHGHSFEQDLKQGPKILSTPIHKQPDQKLHTPIHDEGFADEGFSMPETGWKDTGFDMPEYDFELPGFTVHESGPNILYRDSEGIDVFTKYGKFKLQDHEGGTHKGHTQGKHIQTKEYLVERFNDPAQKHIKGSSSYPDMGTAQRTIRDTIKQNEQKFLEWTSDASNKDTLPLRYNSQNPVGYGLTRDNPTIHDMHKARTIFSKDNNGNIKVVTSYPID